MPNDTPMPPAGRLGPVSPPSYRPMRSGHGSLDTGTRILLIGAGAVLALLLLLVIGWAISGRHGSGVVPTIQADKQPWRVKPDNPGGMQVIGAIEAEGDVPGRPGATAPAPETPAAEALRAAQPAPPPAKPTAAASESTAPTPLAPVTSAPAANAAATPSTPPVVPPTAIPSAPAQAAAPARAPVPTASGGTFVQLAALGSEAGAHTEWQRLKGRMADILAGREPVIQRIERDGHAIWRLRVGSFPSVGDATRFCERVRAKGGACELATF